MVQSHRRDAVDALGALTEPVVMVGQSQGWRINPWPGGQSSPHAVSKHQERVARWCTPKNLVEIISGPVSNIRENDFFLG